MIEHPSTGRSGPSASPPAASPGPRRQPGAASRRRWLRGAGWLAWAGLAAAVARRLAGRAGDDIYITYRYAWNLAHGRGLVFNPGEKVYGVSDAGVALLLAAVHRATGLPIPDLGTAVTAAALLVIAGVLLAAARAGGREPEGWLAGTLALASTYLWLGQGAGPLPALALLLLAAQVAGGPRPWLAGTLAGLAFGCRPDAALGAACLCMLLALEERRRTGWARLSRPAWYAAAFAMVAGVAVAAAWWYFGTPLPGTLAAKRGFAALAPRELTGTAFWRSAARLFCDVTGQGGPALLALGLAGQAVLYRRAGRAGRLLVLQSLALAAFYTAAAVPLFVWYTIPTAVAVLYGAAFLAGAAVRSAAAPAAETAARRQPARVAAAGAAAVLAAALAISVLAADYRWWSRPGRGDWRLFAYRKAGEWVRDHAPPHASIAFDEIGILGYFSDHPVEDLVGLVTPRSRPYAAAGDPLGAFLAKPADLLLFHTYDPRGGTRPILIRPWFGGAYEQVATISDPELNAETRIYRRRPGAAIPPPRPPWPRPRPSTARRGA